MTVICTNLTKHLARSFMLALLVAIVTSSAAFAQDYKESYNDGLEAAKAKNYPVAYTEFKKAADGAKAEGDGDVEKRANKVISQLVYSFGKASLQKEELDKAIAYFDEGIQRYPTNAKNYLGKGLTIKKQGNLDEAMTMFQQAIQIGNDNADRKTARTAESAIRDNYIYEASKLLSGNAAPTSAQANQALTLLGEMAKYELEPDADTFYYMAVAHQAKGDYAQSIGYANQALDVHRGSKSDKAKIYFVKGEAMMRSGNTAGAKDAFQNAAYGSYKASAQHYLETLGTN